MDVSGDKRDQTNYLFLGFVIGTVQSITGLSTKFGSLPERMSFLSYDEKEFVKNELVFDQTNRLALCVALNRDNIVKTILGSRGTRRRSIGKGDILRSFNRVIIQEIIKQINPFLELHRESITDLTIQCESDSSPFAEARHIRHTRKGIAYRISDYVAYCNNKETAPATVREINIVNDIPDKIKKILGLN